MGESHRRNPALTGLWKEAESRHLGPDELERYVRITGAADRAEASREVKQHEAALVRRLVADLFVKFPFEQAHEQAAAKCIRDVRYVSAYATMAMLMADVDWLDDKLLLWLRTVLQAFEFPRAARPSQVLFGKNPEREGLDGDRASIFDTYSRLRDGYQEVLSEGSYRLMEPSLQRVVHTLTEER